MVIKGGRLFKGEGDYIEGQLLFKEIWLCRLMGDVAVLANNW